MVNEKFVNMEEKQLLSNKETQVKIKKGNKCKNVKCVITKIFKTLTHFCYNPKHGTIFFYKPINLIKFLSTYLLYYLFLTGLFFGSMYIILKVTKNPSTAILSKSPSIFSLNGRHIKSFNYCNKNEISKISAKWTKLLEPYTTIYNAKRGQLCSQNINNTNDQLPCFYNLEALGDCFNNNTSVLEAGNYCVYLRLSKILGFKPQSLSSNPNFAPLECRIEKGEIVSISPNSFNLNVYPYLNSPDGFIDPIVAVIVKMNTLETRNLKCYIDLKSVKNNNRFDHSESVLNIQVLIEKQTCL